MGGSLLLVVFWGLLLVLGLFVMCSFGAIQLSFVGCVALAGLVVCLLFVGCVLLLSVFIMGFG